MRKKFLFSHAITLISPVIICLILVYTPAFTQTVSLDSLEKETTGKTVDGLMNVSSSLIKDSFIPMTFWQEKEYLITFVPAYFQINKIYDDPEVKGEDLKGWAAGLGGGYAFNERLLFYGILAVQDIKGNISGKMYQDPLPVIEADMNYRSIFFSPGAGYEILSNKWFSLPLYFGPFFLHYNLDVEMPRESDIGNNSFEAKASGNGILYGFSGGFAVSFKILDKLKITPYYLYIRSFNKPEADADLTFTSSLPVPATTATESLDTENINTSLIGLSVTLVSTKNLSFSASIGGYITSETGWYNEKFLNGLEMKSLVFAVTYRNSHTKED